MKTIAITGTTFAAEVLQSDKPALVDLWARWCGPCRMIAPVIEEIAAEHDGRFKITKLNIDENPQLAQSLGVHSIPTLPQSFKVSAKSMCDAVFSREPGIL
jgi:thioredoxin 1